MTSAQAVHGAAPPHVDCKLGRDADAGEISNLQHAKRAQRRGGMLSGCGPRRKGSWPRCNIVAMPALLAPVLSVPVDFLLAGV